MDEKDVQIGTACMNEIQEVLKKHGCIFEIVAMFSSLHGINYQVRTIPQKNIILANQMSGNRQN